MKLRLLSSWNIKSISILLLIFLLSACGGKDIRTREGPPVDKGVQERAAPDEGNQREPSSGFVDIPLPENFPSSFPIPAGARIGYTGQDPAEGTFQILVYPGGGIDEAIDYYRQALPANGWTILDEEGIDEGFGMTISDQEYEGELFFVLHEEEAYIDVSLVPGESLPDISDLGENFGESMELGESGSVFPADFPLPVGAVPIPLPDKLAGEGYQLAFSFPGPPELANIQVSGAMASAGWLIGEFQMDLATMSYTMPFSNPETGFEGYALMTASTDVAGVSDIDGSILAFHP